MYAILPALLLIFLGVFVRTIVAYRSYPALPGPLLAKFSRLWLLYRSWRGHVHIDLLRLHQKHGPVVRYGPYQYSFSDPEAVNLIYGKGTEFDKSSWYESWNDPGFKSLFTEPSVKVHGQLRRKFQSTYTMSSMIHYEGFAEDCIELLCERLEEVAREDVQTDLSRWLLSYAGDAVSMITYSKRMGFLDAGEDVGDFFKTMNGNALYSMLVGIYAEIHPLVFRVTTWLRRLKLSSGSARMYIGRFNADLIEEKWRLRASGEKTGKSSPDVAVGDDAPKDFLSKFLDYHEQDPNRFTNRDINIGLVGNVVAGSDTTASALTAIMYCLLKHPSSLVKLRDEIATANYAGALSSPPTFKQAHELPYLQAVIQEAMRLHPPTGLPLQRVVPAGGHTIYGHYFPAGTVVGAHIIAVHKDQSIFGSDADDFRPERWLDSDKDKLATLQKYCTPFGLGSRTCIGKNISMLEISKVVPELVRKFDFQLAGGLQEDGQEMEWSNRWFVKPVALPVKVRLSDK